MEWLYGTMTPADWWLGLGKVIWIDLLLAGDNAIVIAMACRALPPEQRRMGILVGAGAAVGLRILFAGIISILLAIPFLKFIGGVLLLWIAYKLLMPQEEHGEINASANLWGAIKTIAIADVVMSLDNVLAIAGAAKGSTSLIVLGLLISIPLVIFGATFLSAVIQRFPLLVWFGAALLGWIAGDLIFTDPAVSGYVQNFFSWLGFGPTINWKIGGIGFAGPPHDALAEPIGALFVILIGLVVISFKKKQEPQVSH
ncbi:MAG: hypothetical protein RL291_53 [Pseudomonadota bacterium]